MFFIGQNCVTKSVTPTQTFPCELIMSMFFYTSGRLLLEEPKILLKTVPVAIPNDISKGCYQNGFIICFLRSTYGRFMEFLMG